MEVKDIAMLLALMRVEGAGNMVARRSLEIAKVLALPVSELRDVNPRDVLAVTDADRVITALRKVDDAALERAERHARRILHHGAVCFALGESGYPPLLDRYLGETAPALLWAVGRLNLLYDASAGVVGTRQPSPDGFTIASDCARLFAREGICVVSGGADGVDTAAHRAALEAGSTSIIVLPQGLRTYLFPDYVRDALQADRCVIISQFDPELKWQTHAAITRNQTIASLAKLVCVVEPKRMGGSMRTAKHARDQRKPVFYYCSSDGETFEKIFRQSNATPLLDQAHSLNEDALLRAWHAPQQNEPLQDKLV